MKDYTRFIDRTSSETIAATFKRFIQKQQMKQQKCWKMKAGFIPH